MNQLCCCCSSCKSRYKRLVDHVYPHTAPFDSPIGTNMQKLTFYSISHPEKLNRIGIYLVQRLSRDLGRQRVADVKVAVDAMEHLLKSCHGSPSLNQFIESYLLMVQRLLETNDPQMEKLATDLFVRFSGIEEDSPSYHRQYDFFISKFSSMCHANQGAYIRSQRFNGLRGLRGVIWKSTSDDLQANIWEKQHMNKIIPSILFNFQNENDESDDQQQEDGVDHKTSMLFHHYPAEEESAIANDEPVSLALQCLRELFQKCSFGSLKSVLEPVFKHFDLHMKWIPPPIFAIKTFRAILYSIQSQNSYFVIQELINHLEQVTSTEAQIRVGMASVLASIVCIAGSSIGPLLLAIFNSLLKLLRSSVEFQQSKQCADLDAEKNFQDTLINALGDFASALPDYQKVEIMLFTAGSIPNILDSSGNISMKLVQTSEAFLQKVLVKTLHKVATKYKTFYLATVFTDAFLKTLLQLQLSRDAEVRLIAHQIFHTLLDRHDNQQKLEHLPCLPDLQTDLELKVEKSSRQDQLFMRRHIHLIISTLYRSVSVADQGQSIPLRHQLDAILCSIALLCVEVGNDETHIELLRLAFALQQMAMENQMMTTAKRAAEIHNLVARFMNLSSQLLSIPAFCQHVQQVIKIRAQQFPHLLNIFKSNDAQNIEIEEKMKKGGGAYSPRSKAPIAHMDSEDDSGGGHNSQMNSARRENQIETRDGDQSENFNLSAEPELLFSPEIVFEAIKASNKEAQRLIQPFRPLAMSQSMGSSSLGMVSAHQQGMMNKTLTTDNGTNQTLITITTIPSTDQPQTTDQSHSTTTSGGLMFSSPLNSRRNLSAMEINVMLNGGGTAAGGDDSQMTPMDSGTTKSDTDLLLQKTTAETISKQNSAETVSVGSSSVDWSPPDSNVHSRRNTYFGGQQQEMELPITVEQLRVLANTPLDLNEEERRDQEKSREVLKLFRGKDAKQLSALFRKTHQRQCSNSSIGGHCTHPEGECSSSAAAGEETLAQTLQRLTARHDEKTKIRLFGQQAPPATIFEIKFPSSFEF